MEIVGRHHDPFTVMAQFGRPITVGVYSQPVTDITGALLARLSGGGGRVQLAGPSQLSPVCRGRVSACASSGALAGGRDGRGDGLRVLPVPCGARRISPSHRADTVGAAVLARAVALSRQRLAGSGWLSWRRDAGRDALELLRRLDRGRHHPGRRGCVLARHVPGRHTIDAPTGHHRRESRAHRRLRDGVRVVRCRRRRREPRGLRVPSCRSVPLQREMVELSGSAGRASAARRNRASRLDCGGRPRGAARTAGEPRLGNRRARAHRRLSVAGPPEARFGSRRRSRAFRSSSSSPWLRSCARCRRSGRSGRSPSSGLPRFCTTSCRCSGRTRGSGSSCSSWRRCWRASGWIISAGPGPGARRSCASPSWRSPPASTPYAPSALWRDVLPTTAHRWVMRQPGRVRVLDCMPLNQESESVQWLTGDRVTLLGGSIERLHGAEPVPEACGEWVHAPARAA